MDKTNRPAVVSFAAHCFEQVGTRTEYTVSRSALHSGPAHFGEDRAAAEMYASKTRRTVNVRIVPVMRRVSWS